MCWLFYETNKCNDSLNGKHDSPKWSGTYTFVRLQFLDDWLSTIRFICILNFLLFGSVETVFEEWFFLSIIIFISHSLFLCVLKTPYDILFLIKGYKCHSSSGRFYISKDVIFNESAYTLAHPTFNLVSIFIRSPHPYYTHVYPHIIFHH